MRRYVQVLQLVCDGQRSNDAIARELGLSSAQAARSYRSKIRAVLREALTQQVLGQIERSS